MLPCFRPVVIVCTVACAAPVAACDLALALAVDVSGSVDSDEYRIQMDGLAAALRDPIVSEALVRAQAALLLVQWTGSTRQQITIPWTRISGFVALDVFAASVAEDPRMWRNYSTAVGEALTYTAAAFDAVPDCTRHLIDLSGDGVSNEGIAPADVLGDLRAVGITVNAIAIEQGEPDLAAYFYENVIVGEGAFVVSANSFQDYPARIRKKLLREVTRQTAWSSQDQFSAHPERFR
ncbi:MAG: Ca-activated chloride channel family protein [Paracoccaceae bacterium]|jgi:Ca-activated chloride channel family protein